MAALTTIAAGAALASTLASTGMSFANAGKQKKLAAQAKADADAAMASARQALSINYQKQQAVKKEPYELEREALLSAGAQAIEAGVESGQAAPTAGRVLMAQNQQQADVQTRMGQEMTAIDKSIINEESRLRDLGVQIDLGEVEGAQLAQRDAEEARALATQQAMQGVTSAVGQAASFVPLFGKSGSAKEFGQLESNYADSVKSGKLGAQFKDASGNPLPFNKAVQVMGAGTGGTGYGFDISGVGGMETLPFQSYMTGQTRANLKKMSGFDFSK